MFARQGRLKVHEQKHVLQLVAEAVSAAGLIEPGAGIDAGVERLFCEPRQEEVERLVAGLDAQRLQALPPRFFRLRQDEGRARSASTAFIAPSRPSAQPTAKQSFRSSPAASARRAFSAQPLLPPRFSKRPSGRWTPPWPRKDARSAPASAGASRAAR